MDLVASLLLIFAFAATARVGMSTMVAAGGAEAAREEIGGGENHRRHPQQIDDGEEEDDTVEDVVTVTAATSGGDGTAFVYGLQRTSRAARENEVSENALHCPPCEQLQCQPLRRVRHRCKGGLTLDICNCCPVCAKLRGEQCGGHSNYLGKCDRGLYCEPQNPETFHHHKDGVVKVYTITKGICKEASSEMLTSDEGHASYCRPKCTPQYCRKNPRAVCSASDNAEKEQECQGTCQHTSCRACRFVPEELNCVKCAQDDFSCLRKFGKCVKRDFCQKKQFPCKLATQDNEERGKFQCKVPECVKS